MANLVMVLVIAAIVTVVSIQNAAPVVLTFLFWKIEMPLFVVIVLSIFAGLLLAVIITLSGYVKKRLAKNGKSTASAGK